MRSFVLVVSALLLIAGSLSVFARPASAAVLGTGQLLAWGCPVNLNASPPAKDPDGSRTLLHVVDGAKNDFEIRCIATTFGFHYSYSVSSGGKVTEISTCIYDQGLNDVELVYQGAMTQAKRANGTPVITVGTILVVEHSNKQGTGTALTGLTPKIGGEDFEMVYDYAQKLRYRLNTKVGTPKDEVTGTDYFSVRAFAPEDAIVRADAMRIDNTEDFHKALATDTGFRRLDYPSAAAPCTKCAQDADENDVPIGYVFMQGERSRGGILLDPGLSGSSFVLGDQGLAAHIPPHDGRTVATIALARTLFGAGATGVRVSVDGKDVMSAAQPSESMIVLRFPIDAASHELLFSAGSPGR